MEAKQIIENNLKHIDSDGFIELHIDTIIDLMNEYAEQFKYDYSKDCKCGNERIGETWCCNQCGLPVSK